MEKEKNVYGTLHYTTEKATKNALLHWLVFNVYLVSVSIVGNALTSHHQYYFNRSVRELFKGAEYFRNSTTPTFDEVNTIPAFWNFLEYNTLHMLYDNIVDWVNNRPNLFLNQSLLLGPPRLRQIRVRDQTCHVIGELNRYYNTCMARYSNTAESKDLYKGTPYKSMKELQATPVKGSLHTYKSGGYVKGLTYKKDVNRVIIRHLRKIKWLDRGSRVVLFELNMISLNLELLQSIKLIFEILPAGIVIPKFESNSMYVDPIIASPDRYILSCAIIVHLINFYYTYVELKKLYLNGFRYYFTRMALILNLPRVLISHVSLVCTIFSYCYTKVTYDNINNTETGFLSLDYIGLAYSMHRCAFAILVFLSWITLLTFFDFNPVLRMIGATLEMASTELGAVALMFFIVFVAYGFLGLLLFGSYCENFKNFPTAFLTMLQMLVANFDYLKLEHDSQILGPIFFWTYMLIFFILLNMCLVSIICAYRTAAATTSFKRSFLWYYIRKQLYRISYGCFRPAPYPEWTAGRVIPQTLHENNLKELLLNREYTEIEADLDILISHLDLIENICFRLTNNIEDLITKAKLENIQRISSYQRK